VRQLRKALRKGMNHDAFVEENERVELVPFAPPEHAQ
jgi:hypothetical protein